MEDQLLASIRSRPFLDDSHVVRLMREQPPAHCILKVESFAVLQRSLTRTNEDYFQSTEFGAGGHRWLLRVYPQGNKKENGDDHLSVSVTLVDELSPGTSVNAMLRFFIYDQIRGVYLTVFDTREKRFDGLKSTWGISNVLPVSSLTDSSHGFFVNDCCIFGTEVLVIDGELRTCNLQKIRPECNRTYTWRVKNLSTLNKVTYSPVFCFNGFSWKLSLYPRGNGIAQNQCISLFLRLSSDLIAGSKLYAKYFLCLMNQSDGENQQTRAGSWFSEKEKGWGVLSFVPIDDVHNLSKGFLVDDVLAVEVRVEELFLVKNVQ